MGFPEFWVEVLIFRIAVFFFIYFENIRRRLVRVLKLDRGFIITKKGGINPKTIQGPPMAPYGGIFCFVF